MRFALPPRAVAVSTVFVATAALVLVSAGGAEAATRHPAVPAQPTGVVATGTSQSVKLSWKGAPSAAHVTSYAVLLSPSPSNVRSAVSTRSWARSASFAHLTTGTTYTLRVVAVSRGGHSKPVTVHYKPKPAPTKPVTPPVTTPTVTPSVFALDSSGTLVRVPKSGGTPVALQTGVFEYAVDKAGDAVAVLNDSVVEIAADGTVSTLLAAETDATDVQLDAAGNAYLLEGTKVVRITAGTHAVSTVVTEKVAPVGFTVARSGGLSFLESTGGVHTVVTYPAGGGTATTTQLTDSPYDSPISGTFDAKGDLYYSAIATGASGSVSFWRLAAGETTPTSVGGSYGRGGLGLDDDYAFLQSATWCTSYGLGTGSCVPDYTVASIKVTSDTGVTTTVPVTGLSLTVADTRPYGSGTSVVTDASGAIVVGGANGLVSYAATGGAPTALAAGSFTDVQLNG